MPKKPSTVLVMKDYPPMSSRRWYVTVVLRVAPEGRGMVCLELAIVDAPEQAGRRIVHRIPAVLAPNSPLCQLLADGFGIRLSDNEPLDLATLAGRSLRIRFTKPNSDGVQNLAAVQQAGGDSDTPLQADRRDKDQEVKRGLG